ncbi:hypothetical protein DMN91_010522 [Ooceraea biroi]|uniref:NADH dehydrogenase [ubiquinone] 1 subunit C2 n=1 Tax=Ooceraea biroi TaxID=2015173 RepID=A0A026WT87_OOCBI|nr:uncharacterized protein LOC105275793 [Ooceraea biroi]EZA58886.1 hypothetical protein X777_16845 [Ooceraea biroi]RLU16454.1 hypothetical protein DMN91_010522 [Ooceraea biroi]
MSKHHEREISEHPEVQWALELLKPDPTYYAGPLKNYAAEMGCIGLGSAAVAASNHMLNLPLNAGLHKYAAAVVIGYGIAQLVNKVVDNHKAERDTRLRDYIIRHPELFPEPERVKYKEILQPWIPLR